MKIFINDIPVYIKKLDDRINRDDFDHVIDGNDSSVPKKLIDDVLIWDASHEHIDELLKLMTHRKFKELDNITFAVSKRKAAVAYIKDKFKVIEAGGGVVYKEGLALLIYRLKKWDLPKGKLEKNEKPKAGAVREVEEETSVKVELEEKICATWHTYTRNNKYVLKKTHWYKMKCLDDSQMQPQTGESIEDVRWMDVRNTRQALYNSYRTVRYVMQEYYKLLD
ncbi:MAG: NUDIX domain-containing protein [Cyclobacteriaceae bacterium]